jgi:hypothetical protein
MHAASLPETTDDFKIELVARSMALSQHLDETV